MLSRKNYETIKIIQDEEGHWQIGERPQQESDIGNIEPIVIHIGVPHIDHFAIEEREMIHPPKVGIIGIGDSQRELIDVLQHIVAEKWDRQIIIVGAMPSKKERKELTLSDFAEKLIEETSKEIFRIQNTLQSEIYIEDKIKEINKWHQKQVKYHHKFHNQKPSGPKWQFARRGRK